MGEFCSRLSRWLCMRMQHVLVSLEVCEKLVSINE